MISISSNNVRHPVPNIFTPLTSPKSKSDLRTTQPPIPWIRQG